MLHKFIVTVILLLCTNNTGGKPCVSTSKSLIYFTLSASLSAVPASGLGSVVNTTAVSSDCDRISSFRIRCCARHGRSLNESGIACVEGKPEAGAAAAGIEEGRCGAGVRVLVGGARGDGGVDVGVGSAASGSARGTAGVATNMIEGPAASSRATTVRGTGLEVNFGRDCSLLMEGGWIVYVEAESAEEELAALRALLARLVPIRADSEAEAFG
jgi:hypothetical protein